MSGAAAAKRPAAANQEAPERPMSDTFERVVKVLKEQDGLEDVEFTSR